MGDTLGEKAYIQSKKNKDALTTKVNVLDMNAALNLKADKSQLSDIVSQNLPQNLFMDGNFQNILPFNSSVRGARLTA